MDKWKEIHRVEGLNWKQVIEKAPDKMRDMERAQVLKSTRMWPKLTLFSIHFSFHRRIWHHLRRYLLIQMIPKMRCTTIFVSMAPFYSTSWVWHIQNLSKTNLFKFHSFNFGPNLWIENKKKSVLFRQFFSYFGCTSIKFEMKKTHFHMNDNFGSRKKWLEWIFLVFDCHVCKRTWVACSCVSNSTIKQTIYAIFFIVAGTIVFIGVKFVNKFAAVALACVICSIIAVYVGIFDNFNGNEKL